MAQASSAASATDVKSVSSPSQSISSPTETNSSLTKSGQDQLLSEGEDHEEISESAKTEIEKGQITRKRDKSDGSGGAKPKGSSQPHARPVHDRTAYSPETVDDEDDLSATGVGFNPTRDNLADGLVGLLRPSLEALDKGVCNTRDAQKELKERINSLEQQLLAIEAEQSCPVDLETYINKLNTSKKRILVVNTILQGAQDRLNKVYQNCLKETAKRRTLLEPSPTTTPSLHDSTAPGDSPSTTGSAGTSSSLAKSLAFQ